jgi:hypothetical protein
MVSRHLSADRWRAPWGLLGAFVIGITAEGWVARHDDDTLSFDQMAFRVSRQDAERKAKDRDVLVFGDSLVKLGVAPKVIESRSGLRGYNLAVSGGQATSSYYLLNRAARAGARPKAILVDFWAPLMLWGPWHNEQQWPFLLDYSEIGDLAWRAGDATLFLRLTVSKTLPSLRCRFALREAVAGLLEGRDPSRRTASFLGMRNWKANEGAQVMPVAQAPDQWPADISAFARAFHDHWRCDSTNHVYTRRFLDLAASMGATVYWLLPPMSEAMQREIDRNAYDRAYRDLTAELQRDYPNLTVVDGGRQAIDAKSYMDPHHLNSEGALAYSLALGDFLRRRSSRSGGEHWVALAPYRGARVDSPLEDMTGSQVALAKRFGKEKR